MQSSRYQKNLNSWTCRSSCS